MSILRSLNRSKENNRVNDKETIIERSKEILDHSDAIVIGAGAGLSTSAVLRIYESLINM